MSEDYEDYFVKLPWSPSDIPPFPDAPVKDFESLWGSITGWLSDERSFEEESYIEIDPGNRVIRLKRHTRMESIYLTFKRLPPPSTSELPPFLPIEKVTDSIYYLTDGWTIDRPDFVVSGGFRDDHNNLYCSIRFIGTLEERVAIRFSVNDKVPQTLPYTKNNRGALFSTMQLHPDDVVKFWTDTPLPCYWLCAKSEDNKPFQTMIVPMRWERPLDDQYLQQSAKEAIGRAGKFREFLGPGLQGELRRWHSRLL